MIVVFVSLVHASRCGYKYRSIVTHKMNDQALRKELYKAPAARKKAITLHKMTKQKKKRSKSKYKNDDDLFMCAAAVVARINQKSVISKL